MKFNNFDYSILINKISSKANFSRKKNRKIVI